MSRFRTDELYATPPPWDIDRPQRAFRALADAEALRGRVLDLGCGTGEHALMAAALDLDATGVDLAGAALDLARDKAARRGLSARFLRRDALGLVELGETFDTALDCGLFHLFGAADRGRYAQVLRRVLNPGGRVHLLAISAPSAWPHALAAEDITTAFGSGWEIEELRPDFIETRTGETPAWYARVARD